LVKTKHLTADRRIDLPLDKAQGTDTYCWRPEEVRAMLEDCRGRPDLAWLATVIQAMATTGLRISELSGLRWSDIDLDGGMIRLVDETTSGRRRGRKKGDARALKSGRGRTFPIQEELPALRDLPRYSDGSVSHGPRGGRLKPDVVRRVLVREVLRPLSGRFPTSEVEVGFVDGRLHSFRHFFCSLCANRGVSQWVVMRWLGHKDSRMLEHYYHLQDDEARRQMGRIKLYEEEAGGPAAVRDR
jgi:integrase